MKVSIIMPVFNDGSLISESVRSVVFQTHQDWELLIMNDGSTDNTCQVISAFDDDRIRLFHQENQGQLVALNNLCPHITGDFVLMLHADDRLHGNDAIERNLVYFNDPSIEGIYGNTVQFFNSGKPDEIRIVPQINGINSVKLLFAHLGSNLIIDHFFVRRGAFEETVRVNYLKWYLPYWIRFSEGRANSLKLQYTPYPWYHYRVYDQNYTNSVIGNFEVYFTRFRTLFFLSEYLSMPFPLIQKELCRRFNFRGLVFSRPSSRVQIARYFSANLRSMRQRTTDAYTWYFEQLCHFYRTPSGGQLIPENPVEITYTPAESRRFFHDLKNDTLPPLYSELIANLQKGFGTILVKTPGEALKMKEISGFLCILADVKIC